MKHVGKQLRRCSLHGCERIAEFLSTTQRLYCRPHAMFLLVGGQLLKEENELREEMGKAAQEEANLIGDQFDFDQWFEKRYGGGSDGENSS